LIFDAHYLSIGDGASANALLKILEEPPGKTTFILVTDHKSILLPTIQSRCQQIDFPPLSDEKLNPILNQQVFHIKNRKFMQCYQMGIFIGQHIFRSDRF